jgi:hypothetical protein
MRRVGVDSNVCLARLNLRGSCAHFPIRSRPIFLGVSRNHTRELLLQERRE